MNLLKRSLLGIAVAALGISGALLVEGARAAPPYSQNTSGTTMDGVHDAVSDLATASTPNLLTTAANANCSSIKSTPGVVYMITSASTANAINFIRLYDITTTPLVTAQAPKFIFAVPASNVIAPNPVPPIGLSFGLGIGMCITGSVQATDNVAATAGTQVNVGYK